MTQPKLASNNLIERLNSLIDEETLNGTKPNQFTLRKLKNEIEALKKSDASASYRLMGILACVENDLKEVRSNHEKALRINNGWIENLNYATSLSNLGLQIEAVPFAINAYKLEPDNVSGLDKLILLLLNTFHFADANHYIKKREKLTLKDEDIGKKKLELLLGLVSQYNVKEVELIKSYSLVIDTMVSSDIFRSHRKMHTRVVDDDGHLWLDYMIPLDTAIEDVVDMNIKLSELATSKFSSNVNNFVTFRFA